MGDGGRRRDRLARATVYLCVDRRAQQGDLAGLLDAALRGGVDVVQLRDKEADDAALRAAAPAFAEAAARHDALFVLNDRPDLVAEVGADGVHVGQDDVPPTEARRRVGPDRLVGLSTRSLAQLRRAAGEPVDYCSFGPLEATPTKPGRAGVGVEPLQEVAEHADRPVFVTGNMRPDTVGPVLAAGLRRVVAVRWITGADDPERAARELVEAVAAGR